MAKRKRLTPMSPLPAPDVGVPETGGMFPPAMMPARPAPIAGVSGDSATQAALDEVSGELARARAEGRMVLTLPLASIQTDYLVRDRVALDSEDMRALTDSLRARGQQTPIEVADLGAGRFGLISGWRRCQALRQLHAETGEARFATVLALQRRPAESSDAYLAMVEENEIRVGLSYFERARIVAKAVEQGVFETRQDALRGLFGTASRAKRSKIGSFIAVVEALDGALKFPESLGERLGLHLAKALDDPGCGPRLRLALMQAAPASAEAEQALLVKTLSTPNTGEPTPRPDAPSEDLRPGLQARPHRDGSLTLSGPALTADLRQRLMAWLRDAE